VGNCIRLATGAAMSTKLSYAQNILLPEQQQVFILKIHWDKRTKAMQHQRLLKDGEKGHTPKKPEIIWKRQQSQQTTLKNIH
jgi:hypothetical protein